MNIPGNVAGRFLSMPQGVILHGSRSGQNYDTEREYEATVNYVRNGAGGLGWHITCADNLIAIHMTPAEWGWSARGASQRLLACEFAQATADRPISDAQVDAFCWWYLNVALATWPNLPAYFPMHSELPEGIQDGKSDCFPRGDPRGDELRARIMARFPFDTAPAAMAFSMEPDHVFSFDELWPLIQQYGAQYDYPPKILAGMVLQESTWKNYRVHRDGTGHGLLGLDDNGLLGDFERWSGLSVGRGHDAEIIPVEPQLEFAAYQLKRYWDAYGGEAIIAAQAWHAGGSGRNSERGVRYRDLIQGHVRSLFP